MSTLYLLFWLSMTKAEVRWYSCYDFIKDGKPLHIHLCRMQDRRRCTGRIWAAKVRDYTYAWLLKNTWIYPKSWATSAFGFTHDHRGACFDMASKVEFLGKQIYSEMSILKTFYNKFWEVQLVDYDLGQVYHDGKSFSVKLKIDYIVWTAFTGFVQCDPTGRLCEKWDDSKFALDPNLISDSGERKIKDEKRFNDELREVLRRRYSSKIGEPHVQLPTCDILGGAC